ncbi:MAG: branched-chain amino acid ABC transporter permease [Eubacteriaceae bacterium]
MLFQQVFNGISIGLLYALMASGLTVIFGLMRVVNFAHGEFYMLGAFFTVFFVNFLGYSWFFGVILAAVFTFIFGYFSDKYLLKPLKNSTLVRRALLMIGFSYFIRNLILSIIGGESRAINFPFEKVFKIESLDIYFSIETIIFILIAVIVFYLLNIIISKTIIGKAIRASFQNEQMAALVGIDIKKINYITFGIGCSLAGVAGSLLGTQFLFQPSMGMEAVGKSFIAVILGGFGSIPGAIYGGITLGLIENLGSAYISSQYKDIFGFIAVILILSLKPSGIAGKE